MTSTQVSRWAIVGTGGMAARILPDFRLAENVALTTVVSRSPERGARLAAEWAVPHVVTSVDELGPEVDVVYIATPHPSHFALARAAIATGRHVVVEKPMTVSADDARTLADLARSAGTFLMEAMWTRFVPAVRKAQDLVAAGDIGTVQTVQAGFGFPAPFDPESRLWNRELGGGSLLDLGTYPLTMSQLFLGPPSWVKAWGTVSESGVDANATVVSGNEQGQRGISNTSLTSFLPTGADIAGTEGALTLAPQFWEATTVTLRRNGSVAAEFSFPREGNGYVPMLRAVSAAILAGQTEHELCRLSDTIGVVEIVEEARRQILG